MPAELSRGRQGSFACIIVLAATMLVAACAGRSSESLEQARSAVATARADQQVVAQAPEQLSEAEQALELADSATKAALPRTRSTTWPTWRSSGRVSPRRSRTNRRRWPRSKG